MKNVNIDRIIAQALAEDRCSHDITTQSIVASRTQSIGHIVAHQEAVVCGLEIVKKVFRKLDSNVKILLSLKDGEKVRKGKRILSLGGKTRAMLSTERVALNFLGFLSGIATLTSQFVKKTRPYSAQILDTRKTLPGLRALQKMAVHCGGGMNHRLDLSEMVLIKDNHLLTLCSTGRKSRLIDLIRMIRCRSTKKLAIEVDNLNQFREVLIANPDIILLDNMSTRQLRRAVQLNRLQSRHSLLEASGGITLHNVRAIAQTGVDRISIGQLTHSAPSIDFSFEIERGH